MTVAHIFKRPGLYFGKGFSTVDEFAIFVNTLSLASDGCHLPEEEAVAIWRFNEFASRHLHGHFKGSWHYDLLARYMDQDTAIKAAMILLLQFAEMLRERGVGQVSEIMELAPSLPAPNPNRPTGQLERMIDQAIAIHHPRDEEADRATPDYCERLLAEGLATRKKPAENEPSGEAAAPVETPGDP
jgi:hypothetical protein